MTCKKRRWAVKWTDKYQSIPLVQCEKLSLQNRLSKNLFAVPVYENAQYHVQTFLNDLNCTYLPMMIII